MLICHTPFNQSEEVVPKLARTSYHLQLSDLAPVTLTLCLLNFFNWKMEIKIALKKTELLSRLNDVCQMSSTR